MDLKEVRQLIKIVENADIGELEIVEDGKKLRISKNSKYSNNGFLLNQPQMMSYQPAPTIPSAIPAKEATPAVTENIEAGDSEAAASVYQEIRSPMVGTFYRSPSPDAEPYVEVGQMIELGQTLCIIEAMKLMNEIESEFSGKIVKILVDNAQPVEYNQVLFLVEK